MLQRLRHHHHQTIDKLSEWSWVGFADLVSDKYACDLYWSPWQLPNPEKNEKKKQREERKQEGGREIGTKRNTINRSQGEKKNPLETLVAISVNIRQSIKRGRRRQDNVAWEWPKAINLNIWPWVDNAASHRYTQISWTNVNTNRFNYLQKK